MKPYFAQSDASRIPLADKSVDLIFTSPPYGDARTYGIDADRDCIEWIDWMLDVVKECCRVCRGLVLINCAGVTRDRIYQPGPEGLLYEWWRAGGVCWRPCYHHRVGIPGSGGRHWLRADVEYVLPFKGDNEWPTWCDPTIMGHAPKWGPGGAMSNRLSNGARAGAQKRFRASARQHTKSRADGSDEIQNYVVPVKANPGTLIREVEDSDFNAETDDWGYLIHSVVGGGALGSDLSHINEAPFSEKFAEFFIRSFSPEGGIVLDPFSGSGTSACVASRFKRRGLGFDIRMNQCQLGCRRAGMVTTEMFV